MLYVMQGCIYLQGCKALLDLHELDLGSWIDLLVTGQVKGEILCESSESGNSHVVQVH